MGSGTRDILENLLHENNLSIGSFKKRLELGNFNAIKNLVMKGTGISFVYKEVAELELAEGKISRVDLKIPEVTREFNLVYLKDDILLSKYTDFWEKH
jgi:DNA-binding transcriptional LysR family regulator